MRRIFIAIPNTVRSIRRSIQVRLSFCAGLRRWPLPNYYLSQQRASPEEVPRRAVIARMSCDDVRVGRYRKDFCYGSSQVRACRTKHMADMARSKWGCVTRWCDRRRHDGAARLLDRADLFRQQRPRFMLMTFGASAGDDQSP